MGGVLIPSPAKVAAGELLVLFHFGDWGGGGMGVRWGGGGW